MDNKAIPIVIAAIAGLILLVGGVLVAPMLGGSSPVTGRGGVDSGARIEIEKLRSQVEGLQGQVDDLRAQMGSLGARGGGVQSSQLGSDAPVDTGPNELVNDYAKVVLIANRRNVNNGITVASPSFLEKFLGRPRETLSDDCEPITSAEFKKRVMLANVGPIRVQMQQPAVESIRRVFERVQEIDPDLYDRINTSGSLCVRQIRGTQGRISTHSFGLAVDLNIDGQLDRFTDGKTQLGLTILADFFIEEGWVWGAGFSREDSMHFEVSKQKLLKWREEGKI